MARKIQFKRGPKSRLAKLSLAEIAFTDDEKKLYVGDGNENIRLLDQKDKTEITTQLAEMSTKEYVAEQIVKVNTGGTVDITTKASITYVDEHNGLNNYTTVPIYTNGILTQIEERYGEIVKKRTTLTYNVDGSVKTVSDSLEGKSVLSTMNYENGSLISISKQVTQGGL